MRLATYDHGGRRNAGVVVGDHLHPFPDGVTIADLVRAGLPSALDAGAAAIAAPPGPLVSEVDLRAPLEPPTIRDFVAFEEHVEGIARAMSGESVVGAEWYGAPAFYFTNPYAVIGPYDDVAVPPGCQVLDYELEVGAVIGLDGSDVAPADGWGHIFGFTIFNDWSARDLQAVEMEGPTSARRREKTAPRHSGPWLVTADELDDRRDAEGFLELGMTATVNGVETGRDMLSNMGWPFGDLVAYASRGTVVRAGDVLGSGTCGNGGCLAELWGRRGTQDPPPLSPGDTVALSVERLGSTSNTVVAGVDPVAIPKARPRPRLRP